MSTITQSFTSALVLVLAVGLASGVARADEPDEPPAPAAKTAASRPAPPGPGSIVFARGGVLMRIPPSGPSDKDPAVEVARLDAGGITRITGIRGLSGADGLLVEVGAQTHFVLASNAAAAAGTTITALECAGRAHIAPDRRCVACLDPSGALLIYQLGERVRKATRPAPQSPPVAILSPKRLVVRASDGVWTLPLHGPATPERLALQAPDMTFSSAPDGKSAAGVFSENDGASSALYVFQLDGKGVRRRLMKDAEPIAWSAGSRWLMVQQGTRACLLRTAGGEYKCWKGYQAVGLAPDGSYALLIKAASSPPAGEPGFNLYRGRRDGVHADPPELIQSHVDGPAVWLPAQPTSK